MVKVTTQFKFNSMISNTTIFNQPLFYLGSLFKKNLLKSDDNQSYFDKISLIDDKSKDIYLEIETYNRHNKNKINYFLDRLNYNDEIAFMFDCAKLNLKTEKICDKTAVSNITPKLAPINSFPVPDAAPAGLFVPASIAFIEK